jgi:anti-sigma factor ChrR (cupin superfamily)
MMKLLTAVACGLALSVSASMAQTNMIDVPSPNDLKWVPAPAAFPKGAEYVVLSGDMSTGPWVIRLKMPANYAVPPHTHTNIENVTVISGDVNIAMGAVLDKTKGTKIATGGYFMMPPGIQHYAYTEGGVIVQIHSGTPAGIAYVNPEDDPRKK